ncbi:MAG: glycerate kinase [Clostridia bacterium]|nr:glycerate kinase [Clostridia bacterium]
MRVLVAPDSFKGSLSATRVCEIIGSALPHCEVDCIPVADGGEGTVDSFAYAACAQLKSCVVTDPKGDRVTACFAVVGDTAVIESAKACGLPLAGTDNDPARATTYGVGEIIKATLDTGCRKIAIGIGGSATNDGGIGCASALGVRFTDENGNTVSPDGYGMAAIKNIDVSGLDSRVRNTEITVLCDVENPLYGENGAAYVYAPQKGADSEKVLFLDEALRNLERAVKSDLGLDFANEKGSGAAGGMGYGLRVFLGAKLRSGAKTVLDLCAFDERAKKADVIITGEGRLDSQSLMGKVISEVTKRAGDKPVAVVCGLSTLEKVPEEITAVFETNPKHLPFEAVLPTCEKALYDTVSAGVCEFLKNF